ncbi:hypothetical protein DMH17_05030 [Raoultella planticola]|nr:hypothetical protein [Raoultella planticola]
MVVALADTGGFDDIIPGLKSGRYDVALVQHQRHQKRLEQVDFVSYYDASRLGVICGKMPVSHRLPRFDAVCGAEIARRRRHHANRPAWKRPAKPVRMSTKKPIKIAVFPDRPSGSRAVVSGRVPMFFWSV